MVAQAAIGYTQYFTHLPALLVELHLAGATALAIAAVQTFLVCTYHPASGWNRSSVSNLPGGGKVAAHRRSPGRRSPIRPHRRDLCRRTKRDGPPRPIRLGVPALRSGRAPIV